MIDLDREQPCCCDAHARWSARRSQHGSACAGARGLLQRIGRPTEREHPRLAAVGSAVCCGEPCQWCAPGPRWRPSRAAARRTRRWPGACREGPARVLRALRAAPADVRLDGERRCRNAWPTPRTAASWPTWEPATWPPPSAGRRAPSATRTVPAAEQLGYLVGAVRRGIAARPGPGLRAGAPDRGRGQARRRRSAAFRRGLRAGLPRRIASTGPTRSEGDRWPQRSSCGARRRARQWTTSRSRASGADRRGADARPREGRRRPHQRRAGPAGRRRGRADRRRRGRDRRRRARRPVPHRRVPDRLGHLVEHERQRGDRRAGGRRGPRQRPREHGPVLQRRVPLRRAPGRRVGGHREAAARAGEARAVVRREGRPVAGRGQGRAHAHDGRGARDAGPGVRRLRRAGAPGPRARVRRAAARAADPAGRHRHRHRPEHPRRVRRRRRARRCRRAPAWPSRRPRTRSRPRATATGWWSCRAR